VATQASGTLVTQAQMLRSLQGLRDCSLPQHLKGAKQLDADSFGGVHAIHRRLPDGSPACLKVRGSARSLLSVAPSAQSQPLLLLSTAVSTRARHRRWVKLAHSLH
jgi:hypothetical protein